MSRKALLGILILAVALAALVGVRLLIGSEGFALPKDEAIFNIRALRAVVGIIVGAALACSGVLLQSLLRNPLASPDLLGLSSGAALAVMLSVFIRSKLGLMPVGVFGGLAWQGGPALVGALGSLAVVYLFSQRRGLLDPVTLVLVGVVIGILCGAGVVLVQHLMPDAGFSSSRLLLGAINDETSWPIAFTLGAVVLAGVLLAAACGPAMDAASMGDDEAASVGVRVGALRMTLFAAAGVLTGAAVVLAGPIGFVGLVCPHLARLLMGPSHRPLVIGAAIGGAALVVGADALIKVIDLGTGRLPLGVITALIGAPVFIAMLRRTRAME